MFNIPDFVAACFGISIICIFFRKLGFKEKSLHYTLLTVPVFIFNTCMLTQAVTADEGGYIPAWSNIGEIGTGSIFWIKGTYQYRVTQMVLGTVFKVWRAIFPQLNNNTAYMIYKMLHWLFFICIALMIAYIWCKYIFDAEPFELKYRVTCLGTIYILIGIPVACLILKVCNYDAGNVYFAVLGMSLVIMAEKKRNSNYAYMGGCLATLGCLEKWTSLGYLILCIAAYGFLKMKEAEKGKRILTCFKAVGGSFFSSVIICFFNLLYLRVLYGKGVSEFSMGTVLFPLFYMSRILAGRREFNVDDLSYYDREAFFFLSITFVLAIVLSIVIYLLYLYFCEFMEGTKAPILTITSLVFGSIIIISGVVLAYAVKRYCYPYINYQEGIYIPKEAANGITYFYGANTKFGHLIIDVLYTNAVVMAAQPTAFVILEIFSIIIVWKSCYKKTAEENFLLKIFFLAGLAVIPIFTLARQPACPRYYGVSFLISGLCFLYAISKIEHAKINDKKIKVLGYILFGLYCIEMFINVPLYNCFSPMWLIRSKEFYTTVRTGGWDAGEAMTWGEELALAGILIEKDVVRKGIESNDVTIVSEYGVKWYGNPGFNIEFYDGEVGDIEFDFNENTYFIFAKFKLYRSAIPDFILNVEPDMVVEIRGERAAWIYTGEQMKEILYNNEKGGGRNR